jgi:hypothetical protein
VVHNPDPAISEKNLVVGETPHLKHGVHDFLWADRFSALLCDPVEAEAGWAGGTAAAALAAGEDTPVWEAVEQGMNVGMDNVDKMAVVPVLDEVAGKEGDRVGVKGMEEELSEWDMLKGMIEMAERIGEDRNDAEVGIAAEDRAVGSPVEDMEIVPVGLVEERPGRAVEYTAAAGNREDTAGTADRDSTGDNQGTVGNRDSARTVSAWVSLRLSILY